MPETKLETSESLKPGSEYIQLFQTKAPFKPSDKELNDLAESMTKKRDESDSIIPSGYTYLSQFIAHDLSLDSNNRIYPWTTINVLSAANFRSPFFDLETIYGLDKPKNPNEPSRSDLLDGHAKLKLGKTYGDGTSGIYTEYYNDLPRGLNDPTPIIIDKRNDENLAVAQTQVAFMKLHNAVVDEIGGSDSPELFAEARRLTIRQYQCIVLNDLLPRIVKKSVLDDIKKNGTRFFHFNSKQPSLPLEFAFAAFRFGHSMVRNSYQWNRTFNEDIDSQHASLHELSEFTHQGEGLKNYNRLQSAWLINWNWFYDINNSITNQADRFNFAKQINTGIAPQLGYLPPYEIRFNRAKSLPAIDLYRNRALGLSSGQEVANAMQVSSLTPQEIDQMLPQTLKTVFSEQTPLWFYILAEAEIESLSNNLSSTLGEVGSRIVAETFIELLKASPESIMTDDLQIGQSIPSITEICSMDKMLKFIASKNNNYDELNPTKL